jgi:ribose transport system substrate-binding protein
VSSVSADNYGNGIASAHLMAKALDQKGEIGIVFHAADFFVTKQRYDGFKKTITDQYPDIKIVDEQGIGGPDFAGDAEKAAGAILTSHPETKAIWAVWDVLPKVSWQQHVPLAAKISRSSIWILAKTLPSKWPRAA